MVVILLASGVSKPFWFLRMEIRFFQGSGTVINLLVSSILLFQYV